MLKATGLTKPSCCVLITLTWVSMLLLLQDLPPHQGAPMTEKSNSIVMAFSKIFYAEINFERRTRMCYLQLIQMGTLGSVKFRALYSEVCCWPAALSHGFAVHSYWIKDFEWLWARSPADGVWVLPQFVFSNFWTGSKERWRETTLDGWWSWHRSYTDLLVCFRIWRRNTIAYPTIDEI